VLPVFGSCWQQARSNNHFISIICDETRDAAMRRKPDFQPPSIDVTGIDKEIWQKKMMLFL
jgi:hypothetical protein